MAATIDAKQEFTFQAEIKQLLHLLAHSLYQSREIALRELISNASDALDKMRFVALQDAKYRDEQPLEITLERDDDKRELTIRDNGIGMTHDELIQNLGTIAHSGSLEFLKRLSGDVKKDLSLIGQFGVGFYSAFMLADKVRVRTRSYLSEECWEWESDGAGSYSIQPAGNLERGTSVILHLKEDALEFLKDWRLKEVVKRYSSFVPYPIKMGGDQVNTVRPIWVEPKSQVTQEQYHGFYQHLSHHSTEKPLWHLHMSTDSPIQFHAVLFCPPSNHELLGFHTLDHGIHLCVKRILVQSDNREILPEYLRFLHGLVDSQDLPLNVSRETLQDNSVFRKIRTTLTRKVLDRLQQLADEEPETYRTFYHQFGRILKEGVSTDFENRERIARLLRFRSTQSEDGETMVSLDAYLERGGEKQKQIYYIGGPDLTTIRKNPNLEIFRKRNLEVLLLTDPIDEFVMSALREYKDHRLVSIDAADLELPESVGAETPKAELPPGGFGKVLELFRSALEGKVHDVRESNRLTDSPCCLVNPDGTLSSQMQRLLRMANRDFEPEKRILEVNPHSSLIERLSGLSANPEHDGFIKECGRQLFANLLLLEGVVAEPQETVARVEALMSEAAGKRAPISH